MNIRLPLAAIAGALLVLGQAQPALAITVDVTPESQSAAYGITVTWTSHWTTGAGAPYTATFNYGDGSPIGTKTLSTLSTTFGHAYYECHTTTFTANGKVYDRNDFSSIDYVSVTAAGGPSC